MIYKSKVSLHLKLEITAASTDYDDPGYDECNETKSCAINERCERVSINAQLQRHVCLCDRNSGFRRINGVCREYSSHSQPCALYENDNGDFDELLEGFNVGRCRKNEECLPPSDRAKHGYCQCKVGYKRSSETNKCEEEYDVQTTNSTTDTPIITSVKTTSNPFQIEVQTGENQKITLPTSQVDLYGKAIFKSDAKEINRTMLHAQSWNFLWSIKSSSNGAHVDLIPQDDSPSHTIAKNLQQGVYEFELKLVDSEGKPLASNVVQVEVIGGNHPISV